METRELLESEEFLLDFAAELHALRANIDVEQDQEMLGITLAADEKGWALQTGDNSYMGPAYGKKYWGTGDLQYNENEEECHDLAVYIIDQVLEQWYEAEGDD